MKTEDFKKFSLAQRKVLDLLMQDSKNVVRYSDYYHGCCVTDKNKAIHYFTTPTFDKLVKSGSIIRVNKDEPFYTLVS